MGRGILNDARANEIEILMENFSAIRFKIDKFYILTSLENFIFLFLS